MKTHLRPVASLPPRGSRKRPDAAPEVSYRFDPVHGVHRRVREGGYDALLESFTRGDYGLIAVVSSPVHPDTLYRGFLSARNAAGLKATVDVCQRGDRVYLVTASGLTTAERGAIRESIKDTLRAFDSSGQREATASTPEGLTAERLYYAMQYQRTRLGLGNVRVERATDAVRLVNTMIGEGNPE